MKTYLINHKTSHPELPNRRKPKKLPAPVAPEQGTALSTTATDRSDSSSNCRATVNPMMPAPTITTSKECWDATTGFEPTRTRPSRSPVGPFKGVRVVHRLTGILDPNRLERSARVHGGGLGETKEDEDSGRGLGAG